MLIKTHFAITFFLILVLLPFTNFKTIFIFIALTATFLPDLDSYYSSSGSKIFLKFIPFLKKNREIVHSFSFLLLITFILALFFPVLSLGFFVGYSSHLLTDSFTLEGIRVFYPLKNILSGRIVTGGITEQRIFSFFMVGDIILFLFYLVRIF